MTQAHFFNFCGFLVQSVPCMLLCLRPFPPESFSIRRKYMVSFFGSLLLAAAATNLLGYAASPSVGGIIFSVTFSILIGVFFGYYPANKAAKMNPIEAVRYE